MEQERNEENKQNAKKALAFIILFGIVSLFSDVTHEGAASIRGTYFTLLGASSSTIGFISGLGELVGYSLRFVFGKITDKTKKYWPMTILGYVLDIVAVPCLALVGENGWIAACILLIIQNIGKALKKPAKDTIMSFAATQAGVGKSFGLQEVLDQIGAFLGPVLLYLVMLFKTDGTTFQIYAFCFAILAIPGALTLIFLIITRLKFPNPDKFEPKKEDHQEFKMNKYFIFYIIGISLFAFGFSDYSLILLHVSKTYTELAPSLSETSSFINTGTIPLLYSGAMLVDAISALVFGLLYDKKGNVSLVISTLITAPFSFFVFIYNNVTMLLIGIALWGIGMGAQESILKAAVTKMIPKDNRATGYGIFECFFGIFCFFGNWLLGTLYDINVIALVVISIVSQCLAIPFYILSKQKKETNELN